MNILTLDECGLVAGGLLPPSRGIGGGGSGGSAGGNLGQLDIQGLSPYKTGSGLFSSELSAALAQGFTIEYGNDPSSGGSSFDNLNKTILITTQTEGSMANTVGQLAHELGHFFSEDVEGTMQDTDPDVYANQTSYVNTQMTNEGYAQLNAVRVAEQLGSSGHPVGLPGSSQTVTAQEQRTVDSMQAAGDSDAAIARALGQSLENTDIGSGQTYNQFYGGIFDTAGGVTTDDFSDIDYSGGPMTDFITDNTVSNTYTGPGSMLVGGLWISPTEAL